MPKTRITLVGRDGCHLCDEAEEVIARVAADLRVGWTKVSIDEDADLHRRYWESIPVVLVDGLQHTFWRVDESRLRGALEA